MNILDHIEKMEEPKRAPSFLGQSVLRSLLEICNRSDNVDQYRTDSQVRIKMPFKSIDPLL